MTILDGPPYPEVVPGSNAIGEFTIGVSPIGDIPPFNFWDTIISQYANSAILTQLIANMDAYLDQTENFDNFFDDIWNIDTAQGYGLDLWGRILGVTRYVTVGTGVTSVIIGVTFCTGTNDALIVVAVGTGVAFGVGIIWVTF